MAAGSGVPLAVDDDIGARTRGRIGRLEEQAVVGEFTDFYRAHLKVIYRFLYARAPTAQDAEDLAQTVFFKAYRARAGFRGDEAAQVAWLFRIARNETASWYRRRRDEPTAIEHIYASGWEPVDPDPGPEAQAVFAEDQRALARLVGQLSKDDQELIQLRFAAGLTSAQIAIVLGCSAGAARQRLHRAIDRLRKWSDDDLR